MSLARCRKFSFGRETASVGEQRAADVAIQRVETAAADLFWHDAHDALSGSGVPWEQRERHGVEQFVRLELLRDPWPPCSTLGLASGS